MIIKMEDVGLKPEHTEAVVKRAMFLAYCACGGTEGMGVFKARPGASEDEVWKNVCTEGDYQFGPEPNPDKVASIPVEMDCSIYGDYVFGRMMKTGFMFNRVQGTITGRDEAARTSYQAWARKYKSHKELLDAALACVKEELHERSG